MDISNAVAYDQTFPVDLRHPGTGEKIGITIDIVSFDSDRVVKAVKAVEAERWGVVLASDAKKLTPEQVVDFAEKTERVQIINCIAGWNFNGHGFGDLGDDPECTLEAREYLVNHPNAKWIREQIASRAADLGNFFQKPVKSSRKQSASK